MLDQICVNGGGLIDSGKFCSVLIKEVIYSKVPPLRPLYRKTRQILTPPCFFSQASF